MGRMPLLRLVGQTFLSAGRQECLPHQTVIRLAYGGRESPSTGTRGVRRRFVSESCRHTPCAVAVTRRRATAHGVCLLLFLLGYRSPRGYNPVRPAAPNPVRETIMLKGILVGLDGAAWSES